MTYPIGIDLGTTNSLIAVFKDGQPELLANAVGGLMTPSAVAIEDGKVLVGQAAWDYGLANPKAVATSFKRLMGTEKQVEIAGMTMSAVDLSSMVLRKLKADAEAALGAEVTEAVVTVPAYFNQNQREATMSACRMAGIKPLGLINEPTAAALAYGLQDREGESQFLVFDLGGGTFDVTVLEHFDGIMEVKASSGDANLGGEDFTEVVLRLLMDRLELSDRKRTPETVNRLRYFAEQAKRKLSADTPFAFEFELEGEEVNVTLTPEEFQEAAEPLLRRLRAPMHRCLYDNDGNLRALDRLILVGGSTRMPLAKRLATRETKLFPEATLNPDHVVALGASVQAALIKEDRALGDVVMTDVSPFTVGVESSYGEEKQRVHGIFTPIVERNTPLPASRVERFFTTYDNQRVMRIAVYQGESARVENNVFLDELSVPLPAAQDKDATPYVDVRITQDVSGLIEVRAKVGESDFEKSLSIASTAVDMDEEEIARRMKALDHLKMHPSEDEANKAILNRLDRLFEMATGEDREYIQDLYSDFERILDRQDPVAVEARRKELLDILASIDAFYVS